MPGPSDSTRRQLAVLARRSHARVTAFSPERPTDWRPGQVRNPGGLLDTFFTDAAAWELIAERLEDGHPIETVEMRKPRGATGYVMKVDIEPGRPQLYIKLQLGSGTITVGLRDNHRAQLSLLRTERLMEPAHGPETP